jgi:RND family efflux transporter MFP subunit
LTMSAGATSPSWANGPIVKKGNPSMRNLFKFGITVVVLLGAVLTAYALVITAPQPELQALEEVATAIRTTQIEPTELRLVVRSQGNVVPRTESELVPEVSGKVEWKSPNLVNGGFFRADEVLLKIDQRDHRSVVDRNKAKVSRARAEDEHARFELKRLQELVKKNLTSQSNLEAALRSQRIATANLAEAEIALIEAKRDLWRTEIRAPYDGLVRSERVDLGQFVSRGQSIAAVYASDFVEIRLPIADSQLAYLDVQLGQRGELPASERPAAVLSTVYGGRHYEWMGELVRTEAEIDSRSRMVNAIVRVANADDGDHPPLPVGLFVNAEIQGRLVDDVVILPRAVLRNQNQVLVVDDDNRLRFRDVTLLRFDQDNVVINGGLEAGEIVNLSPLQTVIEGMRVNPVAAADLSVAAAGGA